MKTNTMIPDISMEEKSRPSQHASTICPFVERPFDNCYVVSLSSMKIEMVIDYCGGNFRACEIYKSHMDREDKFI